MPARLLLRWTDDKGLSQERALESGTLGIGRAPENGLVLDSTRVSRNHARVTDSDSGAIIEDLGSSNGTLVNEEKVTTANLAPGDEVSIAGVKFSIVRFGPVPTLAGESATILINARGL